MSLQNTQTVTTFNIPKPKNNIKNILQKQNLIEKSLEPETISRSLYCKQAIPRLCPLRVRKNSQAPALQT